MKKLIRNVLAFLSDLVPLWHIRIQIDHNIYDLYPATWKLWVLKRKTRAMNEMYKNLLGARQQKQWIERVR